MKKTVLTFGLISGAVAIAMMFATVPSIESRQYGISDTLGYTSMLVFGLFVFFGIRSYREKVGEGRLTFGRGVTVGLLIALVSTTCYALAFEVMYFHLVPDFGDTFSACMVERAQAAGSSDEKIAETIKLAGVFKGLYDHPLTNALMTFANTLPVGLVATAISAGILRRR